MNGTLYLLSGLEGTSVSLIFHYIPAYASASYIVILEIHVRFSLLKEKEAASVIFGFNKV